MIPTKLVFPDASRDSRTADSRRSWLLSSAFALAVSLAHPSVLANDAHCDPMRSVTCSIDHAPKRPSPRLTVAGVPASAAASLAAGRSMTAAWAPPQTEPEPAPGETQRSALDREWAEAVYTSASAGASGSDSPMLPFVLATLSIVVFVAHRRSGG